MSGDPSVPPTRVVALPEAPHPWLSIIDALIEVAQAALPDEWARYGMIAGELLPTAPPAAAVRQRLGQSPAHKRLEAEDDFRFLDQVPRPPRYGFLLLDQLMRPAGPATSLSPGDARRIELAQEALRLEALFETKLLDELRAEPERWQGEATSLRDGRGGPIAPVTWHVAGLTFLLPESAVQPGAAPRLLGVRLRRVTTRPVAATTPPTTTDGGRPKPPPELPDAEALPLTKAVPAAFVKSGDAPTKPSLRETVEERYRARLKNFRRRLKRPPKRTEDEDWRIEQGITRERRDELRRKYRTSKERLGGRPKNPRD